METPSNALHPVSCRDYAAESKIGFGCHRILNIYIYIYMLWGSVPPPPPGTGTPPHPPCGMWGGVRVPPPPLWDVGWGEGLADLAARLKTKTSMQISWLCDDISSIFMLIHIHIYVYMYAVYIRIDITRYAPHSFSYGGPGGVNLPLGHTELLLQTPRPGPSCRGEGPGPGPAGPWGSVPCGGEGGGQEPPALEYIFAPLVR